MLVPRRRVGGDPEMFGDVEKGDGKGVVLGVGVHPSRVHLLAQRPHHREQGRDVAVGLVQSGELGDKEVGPPPWGLQPSA